ncbi:hypothetical protein LINGRAHAP2_LOCUS14841, partial [Linum grandiflorum]
GDGGSSHYVGRLHLIFLYWFWVQICRTEVDSDLGGGGLRLSSWLMATKVSLLKAAALRSIAELVQWCTSINHSTSE